MSSNPPAGRPFSVNLDQDLRDWLTRQAAERHVSVGQIIRDAIRAAITHSQP